MERLEEYIAKSGLKKWFIAQQIGVTRASLYNKMAGLHPFTADEALKLKQILDISEKDFVYIFGS